jgi:hypothetical protein
MRLLFLAILVLFATAQQEPNPRVGSSKSAVQTRDAKPETDQEQPELSNVPPVVIQECERCTVIEKCVGCATEGQPYAEQNKADSYNAKQDTLYRAYLWATIVGVGVALGGILAIYKQTKATRDAAIATAQSAKATEKSVNLQETSLRQWLNLEDWEVWMDKRRGIFRIRFQISNPTKLPLTLSSIDLVTQVLGIGAEPFSDETPISEVLPPNNPYISDICFPFTDEQVTKLTQMDEREAISSDVYCRVTFIDNTTRHWEQIFERAIIFDKGKFFALGEYDKLTPLVRQLKNQLSEYKPE